MSLYAGFDCSTLSLSVVVIDAQRRTVVFRDSLPFAEPFVISTDADVVHASPHTWTTALATMLGRVAVNTDRRSLRAISGSAQQHGSVYCGRQPGTLIRETSPIWMDSSTARECDEIERALGGAAAVARLTGSRAFPRFTGPQIRKFWRQDPESYARTERIHLVSSFLASQLTGEHAPIDHADGSGMNLMDLRTRGWWAAALDATAPGLREKLPPLTASSIITGTLNVDWQQRFALPPVRIAAWSGDNPCSLVGTGQIHEGQLVVSLGTSDTVFGPMREPRVSRDGTGHVFASPTGEYMGITVFRNGSLARERIRDEFGLNWDAFSDALRQTPPGNGGAMMLPWFEPEITPHVEHPGVRRHDLSETDANANVRAVIEAQMMAMANHAAPVVGGRVSRVLATGGASANRDILQVAADVFDAEVYQLAGGNSACLGAALRAYHAHERAQGREVPWEQIVAGFAEPIEESRVAPVADHVRVYADLRKQYAEFEADALRRQETT